VGQFEIALSLQQHMGIFYSASMTVLLPAWSRLYAQRQGAELLQSIAYARGALLGLAFAYGAILVLGGPWLIPVLFGDDQTGAVPAARIMGLVLPVMIAGWVASTTAVVSSRTSIVGLANVIWFSLCAPVALLLIPRLGAAGAALGWLTAYLVFSWFYISRARRFFHEVHGWTREALANKKPADSEEPAGENIFSPEND
jgi:O-antigen/teichoic acid export membrane protein